jgi:hypothetical protein
VLSLFCGVSRTHCTFVLRLLKFVVRTLITDCAPLIRNENLHEINDLIDRIPKDPRTLYNHFDLRPRLQTYVCCPSCYALYEDTPSVPGLCPYQPTSDSPACGAALYVDRSIRGKIFRRPIHLYVAQSLKEWVGRLLSRESVEKLLATPPLSERPSKMRDFWDGEAIRSFQGPDKRSFLNCPKGELRLVFSLSMDGFSPFGKKNKAVSVTAIYMACMNLPIDIRYKLENIFLAGIIPGPHKPSLDQINHAVKIIVKALLHFWTPGVFFTRTVLCRQGRLCRAALLLLVADILAARQIGGFTGITSSHLCSCCNLLAKDIENFDISSWEPRDSRSHRAHATQWLNAKTLEDRKATFEKHSVRWSELLELPYWRAIEYTTINSMHAHWINSLTNHLEHVWGMDPEAASSEGFLLPVTKTRLSKRPSRPNNLQMREGLEIIFKSFESDNDGNGEAQLQSLTKNAKLKLPVVFHLCYDHDIRRAGSKYMQLAQFIEWVS